VDILAHLPYTALLIQKLLHEGTVIAILVDVRVLNIGSDRI
jgi:hypothetical protein